MIRGILANSIMHTPTHSVSGICTLIYIIIMNKKKSYHRFHLHVHIPIIDDNEFLHYMYKIYINMSELANLM